MAAHNYCVQRNYNDTQIRKMNFSVIFIITCLSFVSPAHTLAASAPPSPATTPSQISDPSASEIESLLKTASPKHPRLYLPNDSRIPFDFAKTPSALLVRNEVIRSADIFLNAEPLTHGLIGSRMLHVSRACLERISTLAMAWRLTGDKKYASQAEKEMLTVAKFSDWNPQLFLDVAEITLAVAVGYDWIYDTLSEESKSTITKAIWDKALNVSIEHENEGVKRGYNWFNKANNWGQVCHGSLLIGALAVWDQNPTAAARIIARSIKHIKPAMMSYAPDGASPEGPMYWNYGITYNVLMIDALRSYFNNDFGLTGMPAFKETALYYCHAIAPSGAFFNYADCLPENRGSVTPAWFSRYASDYSLLVNKGDDTRARYDRYTAFYLLWNTENTNKPLPPLSYKGDGQTPVAMHRTSWNNPNAAYLGIKGGKANLFHAHMDSGTFVYESLGVRWAMDFGMQNYETLESQNIRIWSEHQASPRWNVFRIGPFSHNVLTVDGKLHNVEGFGKISAHTSKPEQSTTLNLTEVYKNQIDNVFRKATLKTDGSLKIEDTWTGIKDKTTKVRWAMLTSAEVNIISPTQAILKRDNKELRVHVDGNPNLSLEIFSTEPPHEYDAPNPNTRMIGFYIPTQKAEKVSITVTLSPLNP